MLTLVRFSRPARSLFVLGHAAIALACADNTAPINAVDEIAFVSWGEGAAMLYTARLDGTEPQRVLTPPLSGSLADYQLSAVRWSPDGTRVVVNRSLRRDAAYPSTDLVLVSLPDGRETVIVGPNESTGSPNEFTGSAAWSPDGAHLAFFTGGFFNVGYLLFVGGPAGAGAVPLGTQRFYAETPTWSPDGREIAGVRYPDRRLIVIDAATGALRRVVSTVEASGPDWSPDGRRLVFAGHYQVSSAIFVVNRDGTSETRITTPDAAVLLGAGDNLPRWSPDGRSILFQQNRGGLPSVSYPRATLRTVRPDGSEGPDVLGGDATDAAWRPRR